jgi:hypothetical protein
VRVNNKVLAGQLLKMVVARHEGDGWQVFTELANGISEREPRRADVVAMGLWPSRGMEVHGYEIKVARQDVRKELSDPRKQDAIGRYCDFWWLVISDASIIEGLIVPAPWGVLMPEKRALRLMKRARKQRARPLDRRFVAAMLRSASRDRILRARHEQVIAELYDKINELSARPQDTNGATQKLLEVQRLHEAITSFETASGVSITSAWQGKRIGEAVKIVMELLSGTEAQHLRPEHIRREADRYERYASDVRLHADALEAALRTLQKQESQE